MRFLKYFHIISLWTFLWPFPLQAANPSPPDITPVRSALVTVVIFNAQQQPLGSGQGFFIDNQPYVITNYHVMANPALLGAASAVVRTRQGREYPILAVTAENRDADLIQLRVDIPDSAISYIPVSSDGPTASEPVFLLEETRPNVESVRSGIITKIEDIPPRGSVFHTTIFISPGLSGSPIINLQGVVVGVACGHSIDGKNIGFAVSSDQLLQLKPQQNTALADWFTQSAQRPTAAQDTLNNPYILMKAGEYQQALDFLKNILQRNPQLSQAWYLAGYCHFKLNHYSQAIESYRRTLQFQPDYADACLALGLVYAKLEEYDQAESAFLQALSFRPVYSEASHFLAGIYEMTGRMPQAIETMQQAIRQNPQDARANLRLAQMFIHAGDTQKAIESLRQVALLQPAIAEVRWQLGNMYSRLERYQEAIQAFQQAIQLQPTYAEAYCQQGIAFAKLGYYQEAITTFKRGIQVQPDYADAYFNLALAHAELDHYDLAAEVLKQGLAIQPDDVKAWYNLGLIYRQSNQWENAAEALKRAIQQQPNFPEAHYELGQIYLHQKKETAALSEYFLLEKLDQKLAAQLYRQILEK